jgi:hypothetical protein
VVIELHYLKGTGIVIGSGAILSSKYRNCEC